MLKVLISSSGSGMMQPLTMNEFVQQNLDEVGIKVEFEVRGVEHADQHLARRRQGPSLARRHGDELSATSSRIRSPRFIRHVQCELVAPDGTNWGYYSDPDMDAAAR